MSLIDNVPIAYTSKPLSKGAFCYVPEKAQIALDEFEDFKRSEKRKADASFLAIENAASIRREARPTRGETTRLVNTLKSPTKDKAVNSRVTVARFYARHWSGQHRVRVESFTRLQKAPTPVHGDRFTEGLTESAARKITDSGAYVAATKQGFKTFLTLTLSNEARARIQTLKPVPLNQGKKGQLCGNETASGAFTILSFEDGFFSPLEWKTQSTIGREVSRFMDGLQKKYQRGWTWKPSKDEQKSLLAGLEMPAKFMPPEYTSAIDSPIGAVPVARKLNYIWVAENPDTKQVISNAAGESVYHWGQNPHVHVLLDWAVSREHFLGWAEQIESLWGLGFGHLEKIKNPQAASHYLLKALGYMTKGAVQVDKETGEIKNSQGRIYGNRYGISKDARAPAWECIGEFEAQSLAREIETVSIEIKREHQKIADKLKDLKAQESKTAADKAKLTHIKNLPAHVKARKISAIETRFKQIAAFRETLTNEKRASAQAGKYQITFMSKSQRDKFIENAILKAGWVAKIKHSASVITKEVKQISDWAGRQIKHTKAAIRAAKTDNEKYWQAILDEGELLTL